MFHHYMTKYIDENNEKQVVSWLQFDVFKWSWCWSKQYYTIN